MPSIIESRSVSVLVPIVMGLILFADACDKATRPSDPALMIVTAALPGGTQGVSYSAQLGATGGSGTYAWNAVAGGGLPAGVSLSATGLLSGIPSSAGTFEFSARVSSGSQSVAKALTLIVAPPAVVLAIVTDTLPGGMQGVSYSAQLGATGGSGTYAWNAIAGGSLPAGVSLSATGLLAGTPSSAGTFEFSARVSSGSQSAAKALTLIVAPPAVVLTIVTATLPGGVRNVPYAGVQLQASPAGAYSWSILTGTLPADMTLSQTGLLGGTPTAAGSFGVTVQAAGAGSTATKALTLVVETPLTITTASPLPPGTQDSSYSQQLSAAGATGSYTWSVQGTMPFGLNLSAAGIVGGTPTSSGSGTFTAQVTSGSQTATRVFAITIAPIIPAFTFTCLPPQLVLAIGTTSTITCRIVPTGAQGQVQFSLAPGTAGVTLRRLDAAGSTVAGAELRVAFAIDVAANAPISSGSTLLTATIGTISHSVSIPLATRAAGPTVHVAYLLPTDIAANPAAVDSLDRSIRRVQAWYQGALGTGKTFAIGLSSVQTFHLTHPAAYYTTTVNGTDPLLYYWYNTLAEAMPLVGASYYSTTDVWLFVNAASAGSQYGSLGVASIALNDGDVLAGLMGSTPSLTPCMVTGDQGHELGHAFGLVHSAAPSIMIAWYLYPAVTLNSDERAIIQASPFFQVTQANSQALACAGTGVLSTPNTLQASVARRPPIAHPDVMPVP